MVVHDNQNHYDLPKAINITFRVLIDRGKCYNNNSCLNNNVRPHLFRHLVNKLHFLHNRLPEEVMTKNKVTNNRDCFWVRVNS